MTKVVDIAWKDAARFFEGAHERSSSQDVVVWLSCGTPHVCGPRCNDLVLTADKMYVCKSSGVAWGPQQIRSDFSTGRYNQSANVDDQAGKVVGGFWRPR